MGKLPKESAVVEVLKATTPSSGVYWFPPPPTEFEGPVFEAHKEKYRDSPVGMLVYSAEPIDSAANMGRYFAIGIALDAIVAMAGALMLIVSGGGEQLYPRRVLTIVLAGVIVVVLADAMLWNWMHFPDDYSAVNAADHMIRMCIVAMIVALPMKKQWPKSKIG